MSGIAILGSTGSIGVSTLDVVGRHPDRYQVVALTANRAVDRLLEQIERHRPHYAVMADPAAASELRRRLADRSVTVLEGEEGLREVAGLAGVDLVMAAIVGAAGLMPTLAAVDAGKRVLLANKEALVMAGDLFMRRVAECGATLLPIDSEHNAIFRACRRTSTGNWSPVASDVSCSPPRAGHSATVHWRSSLQ